MLREDQMDTQEQIQKMKSICIIYKEDYPWDVRVEKIALSLLDGGHKVSIACANRLDKPVVDTINGIEIFRISRMFSRYGSAIRSLVNLPISINPFWIVNIFKTILKTKTDVIIVRDLPLMPIGLIAGALKRIPVIYDMAECYPEMYRSGIELDSPSIITRITKSPTIASIKEYICCKFSDIILVMIEESRDRLLQKGIDGKKIVIVSNTPTSTDISLTHHSGKHLKLVYVGFVTKIRGLDILIKAIDEYIKCAEGGKTIQLDIVGKGSAREDLIKLVDSMGLSESVKIHGWLDKKDMLKIVSSCNLGVITYRFCPHWNTTIPNKLFDYMQKGLPVLSTHIIPISRIIRTTNCGLSATSESPVEISKLLVKLRDPSLRNSFAENGNHAILTTYNWEIDAGKMLNTISRLAKNRGGG